jgi:hypothetical protein
LFQRCLKLDSFSARFFGFGDPREDKTMHFRLVSLSFVASVMLGYPLLPVSGVELEPIVVQELPADSLLDVEGGIESEDLVLSEDLTFSALTPDCLVVQKSLEV